MSIDMALTTLKGDVLLSFENNVHKENERSKFVIYDLDMRSGKEKKPIFGSETQYPTMTDYKVKQREISIKILTQTMVMEDINRFALRLESLLSEDTLRLITNFDTERFSVPVKVVSIINNPFTKPSSYEIKLFATRPYYRSIQDYEATLRRHYGTFALPVTPQFIVSSFDDQKAGALIFNEMSKTIPSVTITQLTQAVTVNPLEIYNNGTLQFSLDTSFWTDPNGIFMLSYEPPETPNIIYMDSAGNVTDVSTYYDITNFITINTGNNDIYTFHSDVYDIKLKYFKVTHML